MLEALKGLLTPRQGPRVRFRAMTASYDLIDSEAERVDTQLIVHSDGAAIRDRQPVTLYTLEDHDSMPVWREPIIVETGLFRRPETRSRWVLEESHHIWQGYASGTLQVVKAKLNFDPKSLRAMSMFLGGLVFVICIIAGVVISATSGPGQPATTQTQAQTQAQTPAPAPAETVIQGEDHGWVGEAQDNGAPGTVAGEEGADIGADSGGEP